MPTYLSEHVYIGNAAQTDFTFNKGYLSRSHVIVKVSTDAGATFVTKTDPTDYTWIDSQTIRFAVAPALAAVIWLDRTTPKTIDLTYDNGTVFTDVNQNYGYRQPMYVLQEQEDDLSRRPSLDAQQNDVEQTLAQVMGNLSIDGGTLTKNTFDLKAIIGRNASGILTVGLSKENEAEGSLALPGGFGARVGGVRIKDFTEDFFGTVLVDFGSGPENMGDQSPLPAASAKVWDGTFPFFLPNGADIRCLAAPSYLVPGVDHLMLRTGDDKYARLQDNTEWGLTGAGLTRAWTVNLRFANPGYVLRYAAPNDNNAFGAPYVLDETSVPSTFTDAGYAPPAQLEMELY